MLRDERRKRGVTQSQLAERLGRPQSYVAKIEKGERRLDLIEFLGVAKALRVGSSRFVKRLESELSA